MWIELDGAVNARDLGALPTEDGGQTVAERLLRSDNLQDLSPADIDRLTELGVTTIVDLRSTAELAAEGPAAITQTPGFQHAHHPILAEIGSTTDIVADALLNRSERDRARYPANPACGHYLGYLEDRPEYIVAAVRAIATAQGAALVHCAAGKDRTGVVVALVLRAVGVPPEEVVADFVATGDRTEAIIERLRSSPTYVDDLRDRPLSEHLPRPETMTSFLEEVDARHGGVITWLTDHGFTDDDLRQLRAKLREP
jgi:protein tyrosine/serine phosphatase